MEDRGLNGKVKVYFLLVVVIETSQLSPTQLQILISRLALTAEITLMA